MTASAPHLPLFCFGSLMEPAVLALVSGQPEGSLRVEPAVARDHLQREVVDESFPVLLPAPGERAAGQLVHGLDATALDRVLFFEGAEYALAPLSVDVADEPVQAQYFRDSGFYVTTGSPWNFARWRRDDLDTFLVRARRYMDLYGSASVAQADAAWLAGRLD